MSAINHLTRREIDGITTALGFVLAGEPEPSWGAKAPQLMERVLDKLVATSGALWLATTPSEACAALAAIGQMTDGNARDFDEWHKCTSGNLREWRALLRIEAKLREMRRP